MLSTASVQRFLVNAGLTKLAGLRTAGQWKTAAKLAQETGIRSLRFLEKLVEEVMGVLPGLVRAALGTRSAGGQPRSADFPLLSVCAAVGEQDEEGGSLLSFRTPVLGDLSRISKKAIYEVAVKVLNRGLLAGVLESRWSDDQEEVTTWKTSDFIILPCKTNLVLPEDTTVEWTHADLVVYVYSKRSDHLKKQDGLYRDRTKMNEDLNKDILRQKVVLQVKEPFPSWATALLVLLGLLVLLVVSGGLIYYFRHYFMSGYQIKVDSGVESVMLPCKARVHLPEDGKVEWTDKNGKVHVYENGSDKPEYQHPDFKARTKIKKNLLKFGDFSLTLKYPTITNTYTCTVYSRERNILMEKKVELKVRVPQVEVESGESVQLPFIISSKLPLLDIATIEWTNTYNTKVHVYQKSSDHTGAQDKIYTERTKMNEDPLKTGDLSLTLKYPTDGNTGIYTCTVYDSERNILLKRKVELRVKDCLVEVKEGEESVQLPFKTTGNLPVDATVEWEYCEPECRKVHVYENSSDQPGKQDEVYRGRTSMNEDPLKTGDLSLTLKHPTERDSGRYRCEVKSGCKLLRRKMLFLKGRVQVQDQTGDIRNRSSSIDPTPLMADQSV
ncbi:uncharacterized protein LOC109201470 [Oreochromis niloticus]|uniref:uncharacterized protein LOC109201470 n=1 Tax=Oreochromis niloticus TaxID=8128 RepID=UPI000DF2DB0C|nr:uncharacterized protein LOC109201470 [Oreochromis niloticus]